MRCCVLVLVAACGSGTASVGLSASVSTSTSSAEVQVTSSIDEAPAEPIPEDVDVHLHETPSYVADVDKLYIEITSDGDHADLLRKSAVSGLVATAYAVEVDDGGDLELHMEVASLTPSHPPPDAMTCAVKIFVMRMPQHDLLAIADGGASATGRHSTEQCLSATSMAIVRDKLPTIFERQLAAKQ